MGWVAADRAGGAAGSPHSSRALICKRSVWKWKFYHPSSSSPLAAVLQLHSIYQYRHLSSGSESTTSWTQMHIPFLWAGPSLNNRSTGRLAASPKDRQYVIKIRVYFRTWYKKRFIEKIHKSKMGWPGSRWPMSSSLVLSLVVIKTFCIWSSHSDPPWWRGICASCRLSLSGTRSFWKI